MGAIPIPSIGYNSVVIFIFLMKRIFSSLLCSLVIAAVPSPVFAHPSIIYLDLPLELLELEKSKSELKKSYERQLRKDNPDSVVNYKKQTLQWAFLNAYKSSFADPAKAYYEALPESTEISRVEFIESAKEALKEGLLRSIYEYHDNDEPTIEEYEEYVGSSFMLPILDNIRSDFTVKGTRK